MMLPQQATSKDREWVNWEYGGFLLFSEDWQIALAGSEVQVQVFLSQRLT
jgi:hypothetical protein